jgi:beta-glucanase (GH16 family)
VRKHQGRPSGIPRWLTVALVTVGITIGAAFGVQSAQSRVRTSTDAPSSSPDTTAPSRPPASAPGPTTAGWVAGMTSEFDSLDSTIWRVRDHEAYDRDDAMVLKDNVSIEGGALRIQARNQPVGARAYTTGDVDTYGKFSLPQYFRVEVRAKVPFEQGMWAAPLWLRPADGSAGEIDLVETYGDQASSPVVHQTIHTVYGAGHESTHIQTPFSQLPGEATGWHTYVVEKTPGAITMWVDGVQTARFDSSNSPWFTTYYEAGKRWCLRTSLQVGGSHGLPDASTDWSGDRTAMLVDYIRTWTPQD